MARSSLPPLRSRAALARLLDVDLETLVWLADLGGQERRAPAARRHYPHRWSAPASTNPRLIVGRIAWMASLNPASAARLERLFARIRW